MWEHYYDAAASAAASVVLSNPLKKPLIAETSLKNDRVDSEALAQLLRLDACRRCSRRPKDLRALRRLARDCVFFQRKLGRDAEPHVLTFFGEGDSLHRSTPFAEAAAGGGSGGSILRSTVGSMP